MSAPRSYDISPYSNCMGPQNETIQHTSTVFLCGVICSLGEGIAIVHPGSVWLGLSRAVAVLYKRSIKILWKEQVAACGITATMKARKVLNHTRLFAKLNRLQKTTTSAVRKLRLPPLYLCFSSVFWWIHWWWLCPCHTTPSGGTRRWAGTMHTLWILQQNPSLLFLSH